MLAKKFPTGIEITARIARCEEHQGIASLLEIGKLVHSVTISS
ncbi:hypothetical protein QP775_25025 [Paenibacillus sp. UMB4589-SE434]|nr:hypothetical protein [Paenibacillus sp. UMB4589-SE434]